MPEDSKIVRMHMHKSGLLLNIGDLKQDEILIEDIAHNLARIPRFNGNTARPISVAEHSILVFQLVEDRGMNPTVCLQALLHDATEAYIGDIPSPVKTCIPEIRDFEGDLWRRIAEKFDVPPGMDPIVKWADWVALYVEAGSLCTSANIKEWESFERYGKPALDWIERFEPMDPEVMPHPAIMERVFLDLYGALIEARREQCSSDSVEPQAQAKTQ